MAVARQPRSVTMTATGDTIAFPAETSLVGLTFQGTGLTAAQRIVVRDSATAGTGTILADMVTILTAAEVRDLWNGRDAQHIKALSIDSATVAGTWTVTAFIRD